MLVLTRKQGESIVIGNEVTVTVVEVRPGQVRLGIEAPRSIEVHRKEVYEQVMAQNVAAASQAASAADVVKRLKR
jgi:carbon storage regulator